MFRKRSSQQRPSSWRRSAAQRAEWRTYSSYAFVATLFVCGVIVAVYYGVIAHPTRRSSAASAPAATPPRPTSAALRPAVASLAPTPGRRCDLPTQSPTIPARAPALNWTEVGQMSVPSAPASFGPEHRNGPFYTCFAHNPTGALLAALYSQATFTERGVTVGSMVAAIGAQQPAALVAKYRNSLVPNLDAKGIPAGYTWQVAGYKFDAYTPQSATITTLLSDDDGSDLETVVSLVWAADWKITGSRAQEPTTTPQGYVAWSVY